MDAVGVTTVAPLVLASDDLSSRQVTPHAFGEGVFAMSVYRPLEATQFIGLPISDSAVRANGRGFVKITLPVSDSLVIADGRDTVKITLQTPRTLTSEKGYSHWQPGGPGDRKG